MRSIDSVQPTSRTRGNLHARGIDFINCSGVLYLLYAMVISHRDNLQSKHTSCLLLYAGEAGRSLLKHLMNAMGHLAMSTVNFAPVNAGSTSYYHCGRISRGKSHTRHHFPEPPSCSLVLTNCQIEVFLVARALTSVG